MAITRHIQHIKSLVVENGNAKLPTSSQIQLGEIAINYKKGYETIAIKNDNSEVIAFRHPFVSGTTLVM